jgi:hypothetical protein
MTAKPLTISYNLSHSPTDVPAIEELLEKVRQKAINLGFNPVSGLTFLAGDGEIISSAFGERFLHPDLIPVPPFPLCVCYFTTSLPDCEGIEIGLAAYPSEGCKQPIWRWSGIIRIANIRLFTTLLHYAAEIGVQVSFAYAGLAVTYRLDDHGEFQCERKWLFDPENW